MINNTLYDLSVGRMTGRFNPPFMEWDNTAYTASLHLDPYYFDTTPTNQFVGAPGFSMGANAKYEIYFNTRHIPCYLYECHRGLELPAGRIRQAQ